MKNDDLERIRYHNVYKSPVLASSSSLMEPPEKRVEAPWIFGDRSSSDLVVRLRTQEGRDDWLYCHSRILIEKSKYFADRLSESWPTCQILDSRYCVEVNCQEQDYDHHINLLRLLYIVKGSSETEDNTSWHNVKNALGILRAAVNLSCPQMVSACVNYLEAVPWEEAEEEEILRTIPDMGPEAEPVLARLQPVNTPAVMRIFVSAFRFAMSSPPLTMNDIKSSAQEQLEYMITEDDDAPLLIADDEIKLEVKECVKSLYLRFGNLLEALLSDTIELDAFEIQSFQSNVSDLSWVSQILTKMEIMREFVQFWVEISDKIVKAVEQVQSSAETVEIRFKVIEVTAKVLEAIGYGTVIVPTTKRHHMVKLWLPFVRATKPMIDSGENAMAYKIDGEIWQALESSFVSIILALPSSNQAEILTDWLEKSVSYPDLTEAFEVWCYRSKVAKRRLALLGGGGNDDDHGMCNSNLD